MKISWEVLLIHMETEALNANQADIPDFNCSATSFLRIQNS